MNTEFLDPVEVKRKETRRCFNLTINCVPGGLEAAI